MKKALTILICLFICQISISQNCESISPYKEGMYMEYTNYNKKGKIVSVEKHLVEAVDNQDGSLVIDIKTSVIEGKRNSSAETYILECENGNFKVDMTNYTSHQSDSQDGSLSVEAVGDFIEFPTGMQPGATLKDGTIAISIGNGESTMAIADMSVLNRKVLAKDNLTTPAGTFDGYKISFDYLFDMGLLKIRGSGIEWYVDGIGIVRTESYSKNGKLRWSRELTKISGQ